MRGEGRRKGRTKLLDERPTLEPRLEHLARPVRQVLARHGADRDVGDLGRVEARLGEEGLQRVADGIEALLRPADLQKGTASALRMKLGRLHDAGSKNKTRRDSRTRRVELVDGDDELLHAQAPNEHGVLSRLPSSLEALLEPAV